jgi:hypothetical protein
LRLNTALHLACEQGACRNARASWQLTVPVVRAARVDCIRLLISCGADVTLENSLKKQCWESIEDAATREEIKLIVQVRWRRARAPARATHACTARQDARREYEETM